MRSLVWDGDQPVNQLWGCTDLTVEPFWASCLSKHFHCGFDIGDPYCKGKPIYAARAGVVLIQSPGILGITVGGETDFYVHGVYGSGYTPGVAVAQREHIGFFSDVVPSGGALYGPHLHFERQTGRLNFPGTSLDPEPILSMAFSAASGSLIGGLDMTLADDILAAVKVLPPRTSNGKPITQTNDQLRAMAQAQSWPQIQAALGADGEAFVYAITHIDSYPTVGEAVSKLAVATGATVDLRPVEALIQSVKDEEDAIKAQLGKVEDNLNAPRPPA